jgi:hypothetical protein
MPAPEIYLAEMHRRFGYLATWLPNIPVELGDVGVLRRDSFEPITTLKDLGIEFSITTATDKINLEYASFGCVETSFSAGEEGIPGTPAVDASVNLVFSKENAVVFAAAQCLPKRIANQRTLGEAVLQFHEADRWNPRWVVVTELLDAKATTILISGQAHAEMSLSAKSSLGGSLISLADADAGVSVKSARGVGLKIVAARGLRPLFRAYGVRTRILRSPEFELKARTDADRKSIEFVKFEDEDRL